MNRIVILDGNAVLLVDDNNSSSPCTYGIEFPNQGSADNPTEPQRVFLAPCRTVAFATALAEMALGLI